ncbi:MAG TPA: DUF3857 domain-containing protein [Puia sp.]|nr:DUF3857 domain-containing protein [Puia sp.]
MTRPFPTRYLTALLTCLPFLTKAQTTEEIRSKYPGEQAVILNNSMSYKISIHNGQPEVQSDETHQILYLSAEAGAYLSKYGFTHSSFHELQSYEAYTRTAADKKIKVSDFKTSDSKSDGIFYDDVKETSFDFPAVAPGAVGTLQMSILHKDAHLLSPFFFSRSIPVINAELKISFPREVSVKYVLKGDNASKVNVTQESRHGENVYTFRVKDWPAEKAYADAPDNRWYATHVVFYIEKYKDESGATVNWLGSPDDLYHLDHSFLKNINKETGPELRHIVDSLCKGAQGAEDKARRIYGWVQQSIKYIAFEQGMEGFVPRDANLVCSRRFGDCKDMSSILTAMLNAAGVKAYYTWIGTRSLPYTYSETPLPIVDNHMICTIRLNDRYIFLDGTDPTCVFGMPSEFTQDKQALVAIDDTSYKILTVPVPDKELSQLEDTTVLELTDKGLKGTIAIGLSGYYSMGMQGALSYLNDKDREEYMKRKFDRGSNKFRLDSFRVGDRHDKAHIRLTASFTLQDYAKHIGDEWYLNLNLFKFYEHEEIEYPKRKMPIEFSFHYRRKYTIVLKIPEGYQLSYMPESKSYHNAVWGFDLRYEKKGDSLVLTQEFDNDHLLLRPDQFEQWNKVLENLFPLYKQTVSLSKK